MNIESEIRALESSIKDAKKALPYADGQAYYDDKRRIATMESRLAELRRKQKEAGQ